MLQQAIKAIKNAKITTAFTGAGISVASGIPPFRGEGGLWSRYDPKMFDIDFFVSNPNESWRLIKEIFYSLLLNTKPNPAHYALADVQCPVITQNIDGLHQAAGSKKVVEFHGTAKTLTCMSCKSKFDINRFDMKTPETPKCPKCGGILKPDFVFFKEPIPEDALKRSITLASLCDVMLVIGTTGEIMPASQIPYMAKRGGALIIEVNPSPSNYTNDITDIFLPQRAEEVLPKIAKGVGNLQ